MPTFKYNSCKSLYFYFFSLKLKYNPYDFEYSLKLKDVCFKNITHIPTAPVNSPGNITNY